MLDERIGHAIRLVTVAKLVVHINSKWKCKSLTNLEGIVKVQLCQLGFTLTKMRSGTVHEQRVSLRIAKSQSLGQDTNCVLVNITIEVATAHMEQDASVTWSVTWFQNVRLRKQVVCVFTVSKHAQFQRHELPSPNFRGLHSECLLQALKSLLSLVNLF